MTRRWSGNGKSRWRISLHPFATLFNNTLKY